MADFSKATEQDFSRWKYNVKDVQYTHEVEQNLQDILSNESSARQEFYRFKVEDLLPAVIRTTRRGVLTDIHKQAELKALFTEISENSEATINNMIKYTSPEGGNILNVRSSTQVKRLFKDYFLVDPIKDRKSGSETFGSDAMLVYLNQYPLLAPLITSILEYRSINVFLRTFLSAKVDEDNHMRSSYNVSGAATDRLSSRKNSFGRGCMPIKEAEAYTPEGWVKIKDKPSIIMQYNSNGSLEFIPVRSWSMYDVEEDLYSYSGRCFRGDFTKEHRIVKSKRDKLHIQTAEQVFKLQGSYSVPVSGYYKGVSLPYISDLWLQKEVMLSADGHKDNTLSWRIGVKKQTKKDRIHLLLGTTDKDSNKCPEGYIRIRVKDEDFSKVFPSWIAELPIHQRVIFIEELKYWDSHIRGSGFMYYTTMPENAELVHTICHISGYSASITIDETNSSEYGNTSTKPLYTVNISKNLLNSVDSFRWEKLPFKGEVGCPTVPSGMWLVRYKGGIHITGNCNLQNIPSKGKIDLNFSVQTFEEEDLEFIDVFDSLEIAPIATKKYGNIILPNCKEFFICEEDETFFDIDLVSADARIIAWIANCKFLIDLFNDPKADLYAFLASEYTGRPITKKDIERQWFKAVCHGCITGEHEVLTKNGWQAIETVESTTEIAVWNIDNKTITFEIPSDYYKATLEERESLIEFSGDSFFQRVTSNHNFPVTTCKGDKYHKEKASLLPKTGRIPYTGIYIGGSDIQSLEYVKLLAAIQADGTYFRGFYKFGFSKQRKIDRLTSILKNLKLQYRTHVSLERKVTTFYIKDKLPENLKEVSWEILQWNIEAIKTYMEELQYWDGHCSITKNGTTHNNMAYTTVKSTAVIWQTLWHLLGYGSKISVKKLKDRKPCYIVTKNNRKCFSLKKGNRRIIDGEGKQVFCPVTSTGYFLVRNKNHIMITGNSNYGGKAKTLAAKEGMRLADVEKVQRFYFQLCQEIPKLHKELTEQIRDVGYVENCWGSRGYFLNKSDPMLMNKVYAWVGSSPVSTLINKGFVNIDQKERGVIDVRMQVHDSLAGTFKTADTTAPQRILEHCRVPMPFHGKEYIIPVNIKTSTKSYGECE